MSHLLVAAQFVLIALLAWPPATGLASGAMVAFGAFCALLGLALAAWAYLAMGSATFSVLPEPRAQGRLVRRGPYRWIRHPMYSAVLLCAVAAALAYGSPSKWLLVALMVVVLVLKLRREERLLAARHPEYADYRRQSKALLPYVF